MKEPVKDKIVGTWKLLSWKYAPGEGREPVEFFGENPQGILMYDTHGYMNAQIMKNGRANFASASIAEGTSEEIVEAYLSYAAYWGKYYEKSPGELIHEVEGSLFPNWVGHDEVRYSKIEGDYLVLSTPMFNVTWKRA